MSSDPLDQAARAVTAAADALADAEGELRVAEARAEDYAGDESKASWQRVAAEEDVAKAARLVERADRDLAAAHERADQLRAQAATTPAQVKEDKPSGPYYPSSAAWVERWLVPTYRRSIDPKANGVTEFSWAEQWWRYPEAVVRLEALWRAWEELRNDPLGMSVFLRDHLDHHMPILLSMFGPFRYSKEYNDRESLPNGSEADAPLPHQPPPRTWAVGEDTAPPQRKPAATEMAPFRAPSDADVPPEDQVPSESDR